MLATGKAGGNMAAHRNLWKACTDMCEWRFGQDQGPRPLCRASRSQQLDTDHHVQILYFAQKEGGGG